jgi:hypothetical protein
MNFYPLLVLLHVVGAVGMFTTWGAEGVALAQITHVSTPNDAATILAARRRFVPMAMVAMVVVVGTGVSMMLLQWGRRPWEAGAIVALVALAVVGVVANRRAKPRLAEALGARAERIRESIREATAPLQLALRIRATLGVAVLVLMVLKPDVSGTITALAAAAVASLSFAIAADARKAPLDASG